MPGPINVKSPNNTSKWQMGFNSAFKGLINTHRKNTQVQIRWVEETGMGLCSGVLRVVADDPSLYICVTALMTAGRWSKLTTCIRELEIKQICLNQSLLDNYLGQREFRICSASFPM
jgi:hypothetical protein